MGKMSNSKTASSTKAVSSAKTETVSTKAVSTKADSHHFKAYIRQGSREGALILLIAMCIFLFMALLTHNASDPGYQTTGNGGVILNRVGSVGAWSSSFLIYFFGLVSYLFPLLIAYRASVVFKKRHQSKGFHWPMFLVRLVGFVLIICGATGLLSLYEIAGLDTSSGGIIGQILSERLLESFNLAGSTLLLVSMLLFGLTVFAGISWLGLMDITGAITLKLLRFIRVKSLNLWDRIQDKRAANTENRKAMRDRQAIEHIPTQNLPQINIKNIDDKASKNEVNGKVSRVLSILLLTKLFKKKSHSKSEKQTSNSEIQQRFEPAFGEVSSTTFNFESKNETVVIKAGSLTKKDELSSLAAEHATKSGIKILPFVKKSKPSSRVEVEKQGNLFIASEGPLPSLNLLDLAEAKSNLGYSKDMLEHMSRLLEEKLADFGVKAEVVEVNPGPVITRFEIQPAPGVKVSKISNLAKDLARSLAVLSVRVVEVIPGKSVVGIEIPNEHREIVRFRSVLQSKEYDDSDSPVTLALGNDIAGDPVIVNLAKMPHLLVAGTTGSGKSVGVNSMILSMLFKAQPDEVRFIMVDPKMLELSIYDGIPHLLTPVVTDMKEAANALRWCVAEMERRYKLMANMGVRNLAGFNRKVKEAIERGEPLLDPLWQPDLHLLDEEQHHPELIHLPFIVVIIDEFADMMMIVGKKVEELIARIAQKARAAGIHLILATQRPSVDVITGLIKANVPTRISFQVSSKIDSRTVLDQGGAEQLLGHGDMLYMPPGTSVPIRVHGAFVDDHEVHKVVDDWKQRGAPNYIEDVLTGGDSSDPAAAAFNDDGSGGNEQDALFDQAIAFVTETRRVSISSVQRKLKVGYNRAANLVEAMEQAGVVSSAGHNGSREVLAPPPPRD
jgi:S-DNA-T family DNA segregation ATPase FtsK/SpoIIIE